MSEPDLSLTPIKNNITIPSTEPFDWGNLSFSNPYAPIDLINSKFDTTMSTAEEMLERLVGTSGGSGYLGALNSTITSLDTPSVSIPTVNIPELSISPDARPVPDMTGLDLDFPVFGKTMGALTAIPSVDVTGVLPANPPDNITAAISWTEAAFDSGLYADLVTEMLDGLRNGVGGLGGTVEQDIYDRAVSRQVADNDSKYQEIEDYFSSRGFALPQGAKAARLQEQSNKIARANLELNIEITKEQAELAQKNQMFLVGAIKDLEVALRGEAGDKNNRSLDYSKAVAANAIAIYSEEIRAYLATAEANKIYVEVQIENLKAAIEYNKGIIMEYTAEAEAYNVVIESKSKLNTAISDIYKSEVIGYDSETKAISENQKTQIDSYKVKIENARLQLEAAVAEADASIRGYVSESSLKERVAESMANIAMQAMASAYGAVNASAGISYNGSESQSESVGHTESRSVAVSHSTGTSNSYGETVGVSERASSNHNHSYTEK